MWGVGPGSIVHLIQAVHSHVQPCSPLTCSPGLEEVGIRTTTRTLSCSPFQGSLPGWPLSLLPPGQRVLAWCSTRQHLQPPNHPRHRRDTSTSPLPPFISSFVDIQSTSSWPGPGRLWALLIAPLPLSCPASLLKGAFQFAAPSRHFPAGDMEVKFKPAKSTWALLCCQSLWR